VALHLALGAVVLLHLLFIATVVLGALLLWWWPRLVWVQLPVFLWGALVNLEGWPCPLTTLENAVRARGGLPTYPESFVSHYLLPSGLAPRGGFHTELAVGIFVLLVNLALYTGLLYRWRRRSR
jgi:Protein of Unknown function (DUF2784)